MAVDDEAVTEEEDEAEDAVTLSLRTAADRMASAVDDEAATEEEEAMTSSLRAEERVTSPLKAAEGATNGTMAVREGSGTAAARTVVEEAPTRKVEGVTSAASGVDVSFLAVAAT